MGHGQADSSLSTASTASFTASSSMVNSMHRSNSTQSNSKINLLQNCNDNSSTSNMSGDATNVAGNSQTANQSLTSVRNRACAESNSNTSPHKEIKTNSGSLDISSAHSSRDVKGRPISLM